MNIRIAWNAPNRKHFVSAWKNAVNEAGVAQRQGMFVLHGLPIAIFFCFITMLGWGSWANTQKLSGKDQWRSELYYWDYAIGALVALVLYPIVRLILLPFPIVGITVEGVLELVKGILFCRLTCCERRRPTFKGLRSGYCVKEVRLVGAGASM